MLVIKNATIISDGSRRRGDVLISDSRIKRVGNFPIPSGAEIFDAEGLWLLPGAIDTHVHFRDPGLTHKGDIATESRQALAGGVTTFFDMPNTVPQTTSVRAWEAKMRLAASKSAANYAFFIGATASNLDEIRKADFTRIPGVKLFMGASTGDMAVHNDRILQSLLSDGSRPVVVHAEDDRVLAQARAEVTSRHPDGVAVSLHHQMRPRQACIEATKRAIKIARDTGGKLHIAHVSTAEEVELIRQEGGKVTADTCPQYLLFTADDYERLGARIKCNPSIKLAEDREALRQGVIDGTIGIIDTDHAPHLLAEKDGDALTAASGMPGVRFALPLMLSQDWLTPEMVVERMCHTPARVYGVELRGAVKPGYLADLALVSPGCDEVVSDDMVDSPCHWTPYAGMRMKAIVVATFVNGKLAFSHPCSFPCANARNVRFNRTAH